MTIEREVYTPASAAGVVGVHANTIRLWATEYGPAVSEDARSKPDKFTPADVATFQAIKDLRAAGVEPTDILQRLSQVPKDELQRPYIEDTEKTPLETAEIASRSNTSNEGAIVAPGASSTVDFAMVAHDLAVLVDRRNDETVSRLDKLERQRHGAVMLAAGIVIGVGLVVLALLLLRLMG